MPEQLIGNAGDPCVAMERQTDLAAVHGDFESTPIANRCVAVET